jgi:hypothetical protein
MKKSLILSIAAFFLLGTLFGCASSRLRIRSESKADWWIEGKPFPVEVTVSRTDKISDVLVTYSFNGGSGKTVPLNQNGQYFSYTIPGPEMVPGTLRYTISYSFKDKGKSLSTVTVAVLTIEEARRKLTQELASRILFSPPDRVPVIRDVKLIVTVRGFTPGTRVVFYYKTPDQSSYREKELTGAKGAFTAVIGRGELEEGYDTYYFKVVGSNPDVGELQVYVGGRNGKNPFRFDILSLADLKTAMAEELYASLSHTVPRDVFATRDLGITLSVAYGADTLIGDFSTGDINAKVMYRSRTSSFKEGVMNRSGNDLLYTISSTDLKSGYDTYYFVVTDVAEDVGPITVDYPGGGELFSYHILSVDEIREIKKNALFQRITHTPVREADGVTDLSIQATVANAQSSTTAVLHYRRRTRTEYKSVPMTREGTLFTGRIPVADQQAGYTQYYIEVTETDEDVGTVSVEYPASGYHRPIVFTVLDEQAVKDRLETDLRARITHRPVVSAAEGKDFTLDIEVAAAKEGTQVFFHHRKPGESSYRRTRLSGSGPLFTMVLSKEDIRAGYSQYYFEVREPHPYFGFIVATAGTPEKPYEFEIRTLKEVILDGIDFTPLSDVEHGDPVEAVVTLNNNPEGTRVFFKYRVAEDTLDYLTVEMTRDGKDYRTSLSPAVLQAGKRIDYYISINAEGDEFTYPDESIIPLYFYVKTTLVESGGSETVFGSTAREEANVLEGRIFQLEQGTNRLPQNMQRDYKPLMVLYSRKIDIPARNFTQGFPGLEGVFEWFGVQYRGSITVGEAGLYGFRLNSDDGSKLFVDSVLVIDNDGIHGPRSRTGEIYLSPGTYPIRVDYFQGPRAHIALQLFVTKPGGEEKAFDLKDFE